MANDLGNLPNNKVVSLAVHGLDSFMPENGAFCGGYQGLLYPNPTTLSYPGFNPYQYLNPVASVYTADTQYTGLGAGNPGIDYKNPGHVLGLLDTFSRMAYGLGMFLATHAGEDSVGESPVGINIPMLGLEEALALGTSAIYPSLCSLPTDWINSFIILSTGKVLPTDPANAHTPTINPLDEEEWNRLFLDKLILSYYGMSQYLRSVIEALAIAAEPLSIKNELQFSFDEPRLYNEYGKIPIGPWQFPHLSSLNYHELSENLKVIHQCKTLSPGKALNVLTGSDTYHDGYDGMNEYRSLTELNSVINLVPLRTTGATYWLDSNGVLTWSTQSEGRRYEISDWSPRSFKVASHLYSDLAINISDVPEDQNNPEPAQVIIAGEVRIKNIIPDVGVYNWHQTKRFPNPHPDDWEIDKTPHEITWGPEEWLYKYAKIELSITNKYAWDKVWLGGGEVGDSEEFEDIDSGHTLGGSTGDPGGSELAPLENIDLIIPFSKTFTLAPGCNTIVLKITARNRHWIIQDGGHKVHPRNWVPYGTDYYQWWAALLGFDPFTYVYPRGTLFTGYEGNPNSAPDSINQDNIQALFTITGEKFDTVECEVSL